jgi:hypothetical protein
VDGRWDDGTFNGSICQTAQMELEMRVKTVFVKRKNFFNKSTEPEGAGTVSKPPATSSLWLGDIETRRRHTVVVEKPPTNISQQLQLFSEKRTSGRE